MKSKTLIGKVISLEFTDRKLPLRGCLIDYNDSFTLMKYNPVDYVIDGNIIVAHKKIQGYCRDTEEKFREKIFKLKGVKLQKKDLIPLSDLSSILTYLTRKFGVFLIEATSDKICYVGRLQTINEKEVILDTLTPNGKWAGQKTLRTSHIRIIQFNTDYLNSLKLIYSAKK